MFCFSFLAGGGRQQKKNLFFVFAGLSHSSGGCPRDKHEQGEPWGRPRAWESSRAMSQAPREAWGQVQSPKGDSGPGFEHGANAQYSSGFCCRASPKDFKQIPHCFSEAVAEECRQDLAQTHTNVASLPPVIPKGLTRMCTAMPWGLSKVPATILPRQLNGFSRDAPRKDQRFFS